MKKPPAMLLQLAGVFRASLSNKLLLITIKYKNLITIVVVVVVVVVFVVVVIIEYNRNLSDLCIYN